MLEKYRFDNAYEKIYEKIEGTYLFLGSYANFGIKKSMSKNKALKVLEQQLALQDEKQI